MKWIKVLLGGPLGFLSLIPWQAWLIAGLLAAWFGSIKLAQWDRDTYWEAEIRSKTALVEGGLKVAGVLIEQSDVEGLAQIKRETDDLEAEVARLKAERGSIPLSDACAQCRIPARRLWSR